jgi:hypothetical protein
MDKLRKVNNYLSCYWFIILYSCVLYIVFKTGKLPEYGNPSPRDVFTDFEDRYFWPFNFIFCFLVLGVYLNAIYFYKLYKKSGVTLSLSKRVTLDFSCKFFLINLLLFIAQITADPFSLVEWFVD